MFEKRDVFVKEPLKKFKEWWNKALINSPLSQKNAVCISTIDKYGFPSGRFVDLKSAGEEGFVFCTYLDSMKGQEIKINPKIAMTIWWDHVGLQIRVIGKIRELPRSTAQQLWLSRSREAQLTTVCSQQSQRLDDKDQLVKQLDEAREQYKEKIIPKPNNWGGYIIEPLKIEFLQFKESRLHTRELFEKTDSKWTKQFLQP